MTEDVIQFIDNFNRDFNTSIDSGKYRFLEDLYDNYISISSSNDSETNYVVKCGELDDKLNEILNKEQLELFIEFDKTKDKLLEINNKHAFIYGFCVSQIINKQTDNINR